MIDILYALLFGAVQGLTEFLPISSTGHLILLEKFFKLSPALFGLSFDIALHIGTLFALLLYFKKDIIFIITHIFQRKDRLGVLLIIATIPAVIFGLAFKDIISSDFRNPLFIALNLFIFSFVLWIAERQDKNTNDLNKLTVKQSFIIGLFQSLALLPGVSRSGSTISGGLFLGLNKEQAGRFAFLLSIPIIALAAVADIPDLLTDGFTIYKIQIFLVGMISAFITGYFCIKYFLLYLKKHGFGPFILYRIILAILIVWYFK